MLLSAAGKAVRRYALLIVATFGVGLIIDQFGGLAGQLAVSAWCWILMLRLIAISPATWRPAMYACLIWSTFGEIFLSLVWGLYSYRLGNIPFFIPPGHVFLLWLGLQFAPRLPSLFVYATPLIAVAYAGFALYAGFDTISVLLVGLFMLCWLQPEGRRLYSLMLLMSLLVELYGTWLGNWIWHPEVPYFALSSANPPLAAGSFYCMLDVLIVLTVRSITALRAVPAADAPSLTAPSFTAPRVLNDP